MKKIFTLLGGIALASAMNVNAETVTVRCMDYFGNKNIAQSFTTEATQNADGSFTLTDFANSGQDLTIMLNVPEKYNDNAVIFPGDWKEMNTIYGTGLFYTDNKVTWNLKTTGGSDFIWYDPCIYEGEGNSKATNEGDGEFNVELMVGGSTSDGDDIPDTPAIFTFTLHGTAATGNPDVDGEEITMSAFNYDDEEVIAPITTTLVANADGSYTIIDFLHTGNDVTFSFTPEGDGNFPVEFLGNIRFEAPMYAYLLDKNGNTLTGRIFDLEDFENYYITNLYGVTNGISFVRKANNGVNQWHANIAVGGNYVDDGNQMDWLQLEFDFGTATGVAEPSIADFNETLLGALPGYEEAINLEENPLGAGYVTFVFGGELSLNHKTFAPIAISYNGMEITDVYLTDENVVFENGGASPYDGDGEIDPGMNGGGVTYVIVDADMALDAAGSYTFSFPEGILKYADGSLLGAGEVTFTIEAHLSGEVIDFAETVMGSMPATDEPIDLDEYELGAGFLNIVLGGDLMLNANASAPVTISYKGEVVASHTLVEEDLVPYGGGEPFAEDGEIDPGMMGGGMTIVEVDFDKALTEVGEYTVTFPEGVLMYADGSVLSGGTLTYIIAAPQIVESGISFSELLAYSEPLPGEAIDLENNAMGAGYITMLLGADVSLYPHFSAPVTMSLNGEVVASVTLTEEDVMPYEPIDPFKAPARIMKADEMGLNYTIVVVDFDKYLTEPGTYTLTVPANIFQFADGTTVGEGQLEFIVQDEANAKSVSDILAASFPEVNQDVNLDEYPEGLGNIKLLLFGNLEVAMGAMESVQLLRDDELVATVEPIDLKVSPFGDASNEMTQVIFNTGMEITEPGNYELRFPKGTLKFENGEKTLAGSFYYTIAEPMAIVAYDITPRPYDEGLGNEVNSLSKFTLTVSRLDYMDLEVNEDAQIDLLFADGKKMPLTAQTIDGLEDLAIQFTLPYAVYLPGDYTLVIPAGSLTVMQLDGKKVDVQNIEEDYVIAEGEPVEFLGLLAMAEPDFRDTIDLANEENAMGLSWVNFMLSTHLAKVAGSEAAVTISKDEEVIATGNVEVIDDSLFIPADDDVDPGMALGGESILAIDFGMDINTVGTYTLTIPDGLFWANNSPVLGAEIEYVLIDSNVGVNGVFGNASEYNVVDLNGRVILRNASAEQVNALGAGLYIINGVKVIKK